MEISGFEKSQIRFFLENKSCKSFRFKVKTFRLLKLREFPKSRKCSTFDAQKFARFFS